MDKNPVLGNISSLIRDNLSVMSEKSSSLPEDLDINNHMDETLVLGNDSSLLRGDLSSM